MEFPHLRFSTLTTDYVQYIGAVHCTRGNVQNDGCKHVTAGTVLKLLSRSELSMGWVDPWVWLGWVEIFQFFVGWVGFHCSKSTKNLLAF